jgi:hypothetical protein
MDHISETTRLQVTRQEGITVSLGLFSVPVAQFVWAAKLPVEYVEIGDRDPIEYQTQST